MTYDAVVVGGGLGGLAAAVHIARRGRRVLVLERASTVGGRARTEEHAGFSFNHGAHALYPRAAALLAELGVRWSGKPPASRGFAAVGDRLHTLPAGLVSMLTTGLLTLSEKLEIARLLANAQRIDAAGARSTTVRAWVDGALEGAGARAFFEALLRVSSYADAPTIQSAGYALELLQQVLRQNVVYVDGGWQTLVDGLTERAEAAGASIVRGAHAVGIARDGGRVRGVHLEDGTTIEAARVVVAAAPKAAARLAASPALSAWAARARPARAACLDVALSKLPLSRATFALGVDRPVYLSVHSDAARLAPDGGALVHVAKYLDPEAPVNGLDDGGCGVCDVRAELEALLDRVQPGWRPYSVHARFLPALTVANAIPLAVEGGVDGRPRVELADSPGVLVVGDWVGEGHLVEAALQSAADAALAIDGAAARAVAA